MITSSIKCAIVLSILSSATCVFAAPNLTVDLTSIGGPDMDIKRGLTFFVFGYTRKERKRIDRVAELGLDLVALGQNLISDDSDFEKPQKEFYLDGNGTIQTQVDADVISVRQYANQRGLEVVYQISGTPYYGLYHHGAKRIHNYSHGIVPMDTDREWSGRENYYPVPKSEYRGYIGTKIAEWAIKVEENDGSMQSIWVGTQEPVHSLGFPLSSKRGRPERDAERKKNIQLYLDTWKNTANDLNKAGFKVGGIQLTGANADKIDFTIKNMRAKNIYFDYFTVQQFKGEQTNYEIFSALKKSLISNGYKWKKRLLMNHYSVKTPDWEKSASGIIDWLGAEKVVVDHADLIYGYAQQYSAVAHSQIFADTLRFVQKMVKSRRKIMANPGLDGFTGSDKSRCTSIIWNTAYDSKSIEVKLEHMPVDYKNKYLTVLVGNGSRLSKVPAVFDPISKTIKGFTLPQRSYALIEIK